METLKCMGCEQHENVVVKSRGRIHEQNGLPLRGPWYFVQRRDCGVRTKLQSCILTKGEKKIV
ncbi:hypothetical protein PanWU01x14_265590 [Parasponia andersonii]|uniref:Uncharacterized protein n=1 Tax=Parasponia andersonii TaxID=3476 RepID=A0A2P5B6Y6_PARAD|nr:hypothetical protein PanWU01x14_265590 [Parasponia andersonii]